MRINTDFKKGFWVGLGVAAALAVASLAMGVVRKA